MEEYALLSARVVCTIEGVSGLIFNLALLSSLLQRSSSLLSNSKIYRIPIYVSSIQGLTLCTLISVMNYVHIFREGTFVIALFGQLVPLFPRVVCDIGVESFAPDFLPTPQFNEFIEQIATDLYKINSSQPIVVVGTTITRTKLNDDRSMLRILIFFVMLPYVSSYAYFLVMVFQIRKRLGINGTSVSERTIKLQKSFFLMQMLQFSYGLAPNLSFEGFLPLAIISIPYVVFIVGALLHSNLDFVTLLFTVFLWLCPVVQAAVQLRFVRESNARSSEERGASAVSTTRPTMKRIPSQTEW